MGVPLEMPLGTVPDASPWWMCLDTGNGASSEAPEGFWKTVSLVVNSSLGLVKVYPRFP